MNIVLVLGCWGRNDFGFNSCNSVENIILDITQSSKINTEIVEYLDSHYKLFDKPLYTNIHTVLFGIQDKFSIKGKPVFEKNFFKAMEEFCIMHRRCGLYLRLDLIEEGSKI